MIAIFGRAGSHEQKSWRPALYRLSYLVIAVLFIFGALVQTGPVVGIACGLTVGVLGVAMFVMARNHTEHTEPDPDPDDVFEGWADEDGRQ